MCIRDSQWGLWVDKINSQYGATKKLSYFLMNFFSKLLGWLDKGVQMLNRLADKVGGMENLLKLVAMAAGSIWLADVYKRQKGNGTNVSRLPSGSILQSGTGSASG